MDILAQYEKENPEQKEASQKIFENPSEDDGPIISFVMRLFRGRIQNERQANFVLVIIASIIAVVAIIFFVAGTNDGSGIPLPYEQTYKPSR